MYRASLVMGAVNYVAARIQFAERSAWRCEPRPCRLSARVLSGGTAVNRQPRRPRAVLDPAPEPNQRPPGLPKTFCGRFMGLRRGFPERLNGASGGNVAGSRFSP